MPFLNKLKKELEGLHLGDRLQTHQQEPSAPSSTQENSYGYQNPPENFQSHQQQSYSTYAGQQSYPVSSQYQNHDYQQYDAAHQPYTGQQTYLVQHSYGSQTKSNFPTSPGAVQQAQNQQQPQPSLDGFSGDPNNPYLQAPTAAFAHDQSLSHSPSPQWAAQPSNHQGHQGYPGQPACHNTGDAMQQKLPNGSNSHSFLAAAGGFAAGGAAGYFVKDRIDARKAKKRHGRNASDFADFSEYPNMEVALECNICDQVISGPYAHCKKCDGGDYDICRDCLAQGETCDGRGKHNLVKVYPKYYCDICDQCIVGQFYHCARCNNSDWDICQACLDKGNSCLGPAQGETHDLTKLYIPVVKHEKKRRYSNSSSSSSSSSDSD